MGDLEGCLSRHCLVDLAFRPTINHWESREEVQLELRDIRPASQMPLLASRQVSASLLREPVELVDARHVQDKRAYLARLREAGERPLIVVNSPKEAASLAEQLIVREPRAVARSMILPSRCGSLSPAAFPEGFTTVVLWDLPLAPIQLRWTLGEKTHLLFNSQDGPRTQGLRDDVLPTRERLALVYRSLRDEWSYGETFSQEEAWRLPDLADADPLMVSMALSIFQEVGLLRREGGSFALVKPPAGKVDLTLSMLYNESRISPGEFRRFSNFLLTAPIHDLQAYCQGYRGWKETPDGSQRLE